MEFDPEVWTFEKKRLERVLAYLEKQLETGRDSVDRRKREAISIQKSMWDNVNPTPGGDLDDIANIWQYQMDIEREGRKAIQAANQVGRLERMLRTPYFGRIDFREDGEVFDERIYIGISNLLDMKTHENLVYDWRAPVSSMFYDCETGKAGYNCPEGFIEGEMSLKRQYRIWLGKIEFMFDSSLKIDDEILQEILSKSADSRMRTIVTSIQREQNKIIRDDVNRLLIVQGPAGSGKTSIALHRVAYLLYRYRELVLADNIVIFSPNRIFNDYISNVLPELGEENMYRTTFMEYAGSILGGRLKLEDMGRQMEYILSCKKVSGYDTRIGGIAYKASAGFINVLKGYAKNIEDSISFEDIAYNGVVIETKEEIGEYFNGLKFLPPVKRLEKIRNRLVDKLDPLMRERIEQLIAELAETGEYLDKAEMRGRATYMTREEFRPLRERIFNMTRLDTVEAYINLFKDRGLFAALAEDKLPDGFDDIGRYTAASIGGGNVHYEDTAPLLLLNGLLSGVSGTSHIKHVIVDEVQDYTPAQFEVLRQLFGQCSLTMLGDLNQSINPYMNIGKYQIVKDIFGIESTAFLKLNKSYRSTRQINEFCGGLLNREDSTEYVNREGLAPGIICPGNMESLYESMTNDIRNFKETGSKTIAVICRTAEDSRKAFEQISHSIDMRLVTVDDDEFFADVSVIPSYLAKGLEFDAVLVLCGYNDYVDEDERKLFYTCCTRALHRLQIYCLGDIPAFLKSQQICHTSAHLR